jgi:hypothetical protein
MNKNCIICNKEYEAKNWASKTCSNECRLKHNKARNAVANQKRATAFFCKFCNNFISDSAPKTQKYCSFECSTNDRSKFYLENYLHNQQNYCYDRNMSYFKPYFLEEQEHKCAICNLEDEWNGKKLVFVLDHIDGNASNNMRENLRLVCPNCDSQLDTFKRKNKNSARKERYLKNYKN